VSALKSLNDENLPFPKGRLWQKARIILSILLLIRAYSKSRIFARPKKLNKIGPQNQLFDASADFRPT
jgi:hypothetical protein